MKFVMTDEVGFTREFFRESILVPNDRPLHDLLDVEGNSPSDFFAPVGSLSGVEWLELVIAETKRRIGKGEEKGNLWAPGII